MEELQFLSGILLGYGVFGLSKHGEFIFSKKCRRNSYLFILLSGAILAITIIKF